MLSFTKDVVLINSPKRWVFTDDVENLKKKTIKLFALAILCPSCCRPKNAPNYMKL